EGLGTACGDLDPLLRVPMGETWLVIDPARNSGLELEGTGVADAFQVYALVHRALYRAGHWAGRAPTDVVEVAEGIASFRSGGDYIPPFALFRWSAIDADRRVPDNMTHAMDWYSNSAIPAELARYEGRRIAVVGRSPMKMLLPARRRFRELRARVDQKR